MRPPPSDQHSLVRTEISVRPPYFWDWRRVSSLFTFPAEPGLRGGHYDSAAGYLCTRLIEMNPPQSSRLAFIDWLRGFSILFMIETHTFNSLLKPFLKEEGWFHVLNFFNGLVAPSFLFASGWAFVAAS